jgi:hypothetical protein
MISGCSEVRAVVPMLDDAHAAIRARALTVVQGDIEGSRQEKWRTRPLLGGLGNGLSIRNREIPLGSPIDRGNRASATMPGLSASVLRGPYGSAEGCR